jgi:hypothetical protein
MPAREREGQFCPGSTYRNKNNTLQLYQRTKTLDEITTWHCVQDGSRRSACAALQLQQDPVEPHVVSICYKPWNVRSTRGTVCVYAFSYRTCTHTLYTCRMHNDG